MLITRKIPFRRRRTQKQAPPVPLELVAAAYDATGPNVLMTFDRAVDPTGMDVGQVRLFDGETTFRNYVGQGVMTPEGPESVRVSLMELGATGAGNVSLTVLDENGIVAVDDGGTWDGVNDLALPFPP
jgi:hypothetical protein